MRRATEEGSPQGGPLSPLLANIYLNEYDQEMESRGVTIIRYADDIVALAKSKPAAMRLLESSRTYLERKLKLHMNTLKSKVVSVVAQKHFKFLGFALGKNGRGVYVRMRMYIWKQWKKPRMKVQNLRKLGIPEWQAYQWGNTRLGYWRIAGSVVLNRSITNEKLIQAGYYDFPAQYEPLRQMHSND